MASRTENEQGLRYNLSQDGQHHHVDPLVFDCKLLLVRFTGMFRAHLLGVGAAAHCLLWHGDPTL